MKLALEFFGGDEFAASTFLNKYALRDKDGNILEEDPNQTILRVMKVLAAACPEEKTIPAFYDEQGNPTSLLSKPSEEWLKRVLKEDYQPWMSNKQYTWLEIFIEACNKFKGVCPQGSVLSAAGNNEFPQSLSNCFVVPSPNDTIAGIISANEKMAQIFKRRGGCGIDLSTLRPEGAKVKNAANTSSGAWGWANHFSNTGRDVGQNGRRAAEMLSLHIKHPDSIKWASMKRDLTYCTGANVSLWLTDEFMTAVKNKEKFTLQFPVDSDSPIIKEEVEAIDLWNTICENAWSMAEPGLLNYDTITKTLPAHFYKNFEVRSTNPCCFRINSDAFVFTNNGIKQIENVTAEDEVWIDSEKIWSKTSGYFKAGKAEVFKVTLANGVTLDITANHKLSVVQPVRTGTRVKYANPKMIELRDIKIGDKIELHTNEVSQEIFGNKGSYEEGLLLGWLTGDGSLSYVDSNSDFPSTILAFWEKEHDVAYLCEKILNDYNVPISIRECKNHENHVKRLVSHTFTSKFTYKYQVNMWKFKEGFNPFLFEASKEFIRGYLSSYFTADGTVSSSSEIARSKRASVSLASIDKIRLMQVRYLLNAFGIRSHLGLMRKAGSCVIRDKEWKTQDCYRLSISGKTNILKFAKEIGFISKCKKDKLAAVVCEVSKFSKIEKLFNYSEVRSIESIGEHEVGCIEVPIYNKFTVNGVISSNSEIPLSEYDSCRLISIRLIDFVKFPFTSNAHFDFEAFEKSVRICVRMGEALVNAEIDHVQSILNKIKTEKNLAKEDQKKEFDLEISLWEKIQETARQGRRLGLGDHGWADMLSCLCIKYDSKEAIEIAGKIKKLYRDSAYDESVEIAKECGAFPVWDWETEKECEFFKTFPKELIIKMKKYGRRHISLLTNAPTGSLSVIGQCSSGIEPTFRQMYIRRRKINSSDLNSRIDFIDQNGDKWMEFPIFEKNIERYFSIRGEPLPQVKTDKELNDVLPDYFITSDRIDWKKRIDFQAELTKYTDHSISSTLNLPADVSVETVSELYFYAWEKGLKGVTVYRDGCRSGVLLSGETHQKQKELGRPETIIRQEAAKRPKSLPCEVHITTVGGEEYVVIVSFLGDSIYEVFAGEHSNHLPEKKFSGEMIKQKEGIYILKYEHKGKIEEVDVNKYFKNDQHAALTRLISTALRHGTPISFIVEQLMKATDSFFGFEKSLARVLKKYAKKEDIARKILANKGEDDIEVQFTDGCLTIVNHTKNTVESKCD